MVTLTSLVFVTGLVVAVWAILETVLPARQRIWTLLIEGVQQPVEMLPAVRVSSRRGVVRQRVTAPAVAIRAAA